MDLPGYCAASAVPATAQTVTSTTPAFTLIEFAGRGSDYRDLRESVASWIHACESAGSPNQVQIQPENGLRQNRQSGNLASMVLNHINSTVTNALETQQFLAKYFGMKPMGKGNERMAFLTDERGMILSMFTAADVSYPETFHIGFGQETPEKVDEIYERLRADGYEVDAPSRMHGSWTFYFKAPGGFTIEVLS